MRAANMTQSDLGQVCLGPHCLPGHGSKLTNKQTVRGGTCNRNFRKCPDNISLTKVELNLFLSTSNPTLSFNR